MVDTTTLSSLGEKLKMIRVAEGLSRQQFFAITAIPCNTQKFYETGRTKGVDGETLLKITSHPQFMKYTLWLMTGITEPKAGQIQPVEPQTKAEKDD